MEETDYKIIYKLRAFYQEVLFQKIREYIVKVLGEKKISIGNGITEETLNKITKNALYNLDGDFALYISEEAAFSAIEKYFDKNKDVAREVEWKPYFPDIKRKPEIYDVNIVLVGNACPPDDSEMAKIYLKGILANDIRHILRIYRFDRNYDIKEDNDSFSEIVDQAFELYCADFAQHVREHVNSNLILWLKEFECYN